MTTALKRLRKLFPAIFFLHSYSSFWLFVRLVWINLLCLVDFCHSNSRCVNTLL